MKKKPVVEVLKIQLVHNKSTYFPRPKDDTYYGVLFDRDDQHITIKGFRSDIEGRLVFGTIDRFILGDVKIEKLSPESLRFIPEEEAEQT
jgi:hypothetical protein